MGFIFNDTIVFIVTYVIAQEACMCQNLESQLDSSSEPKVVCNRVIRIQNVLSCFPCVLKAA